MGFPNFGHLVGDAERPVETLGTAALPAYVTQFDDYPWDDNLPGPCYRSASVVGGWAKGALKSATRDTAHEMRHGVRQERASEEVGDVLVPAQ